MSKTRIISGEDLPTIPWEDRPEKCADPIWRFSRNPITTRNPLKGVARIFNSSVLPFEGGYIGVFRGEQRNGIPQIYLGRSVDGILWDFEAEQIRFMLPDGTESVNEYAYDPRLVKIDAEYYMMWCTDYHGATIGFAKTQDFKHFERLDNPFLPFNRNAVLFPRQVNGKYLMLSRPSDNGHTPFGDIYISESPDLIYWGKHRHVLGTTQNWWENLKVGGGATPIETDLGWLLFYHGVSGTCSGLVYSIGCVILDIGDPSIVRYRCNEFLLTPETEYEERGFVPNVCFPCATLQDANTGRIAIYYGAADSCVALAFAYLDELVAYIKEHNNASCTRNDSWRNL